WPVCWSCTSSCGRSRSGWSPTRPRRPTDPPRAVTYARDGSPSCREGDQRPPPVSSRAAPAAGFRCRPLATPLAAPRLLPLPPMTPFTPDDHRAVIEHGRRLRADSDLLIADARLLLAEFDAPVPARRRAVAAALRSRRPPHRRSPRCPPGRSQAVAGARRPLSPPLRDHRLRPGLTGGHREQRLVPPSLGRPRGQPVHG